jgi:LacI family transcriptional regulator
VTRIVIDNYQAVVLGLRHLKELGHKNIAFFKGPEHNGDTECRWNAILKATAELGLTVKPELTATMGNYFEAGEKSMMQRGYDAAMMLMQKSRDFTAVLAFNDVSAVGAIRAIQDIGLSMPGSISVVGIDDIQIAAFISPRLTTIRQPLRHMGAIAATTLLQRIQGETIPEETVVQPELVVRESTAPWIA